MVQAVPGTTVESQQSELDTERRVSEIEAQLQALLAPAGRKPTPRGYGDIEGDQYLDCIPRITCADGLTLSVQTGPSHYCGPRNGLGPWHSVEIGFPNRKVDAFMPFIDGGEDTDPTETVYGHVPLRIVAEVIAQAGGIVS